MYVIVYCNKGPDQGAVYLTRPLDGHEILDTGTFAAVVADQLGWSIAEPTGHIPNTCGDIRVEFLDHEPDIVAGRYQGSVRIWSGASFYFQDG